MPYQAAGADTTKKIDFQIRKTDAEWFETHDRFWLSATPRLFEWLRWIIVLSAVTYAERRTNSILLKSLSIVCYFFMLVSFQSFFAQCKFENFPRVKSGRKQFL